MRFGSTAKVLAKCKLKYYRISGCEVLLTFAAVRMLLGMRYYEIWEYCQSTSKVQA